MIGTLTPRPPLPQAGEEEVHPSPIHGSGAGGEGSSRLSFFALLLALALAVSVSAQEPSIPATPGGLVALGALLFQQMTVVPQAEPPRVADALASELTARLPGLRCVEEGGAFLVDERDPSDRLALGADLVLHPADLAAFVDRALARRPEVAGPEAMAEVLAATARTFDPYAQVMTRDAFRGQVDRIDRREAGVGIEWTPEPQGARVAAVTPRSPAQRAGLRPGDLVVEADGTPLAGLSPEAMRAHVRGPAGSVVTFVFVREGTGARRTVRLARVRYVGSAVSAEDLDGGLVRVRIVQFTEAAPGDLREALRGRVPRLTRRGGVILDLRGNAGGHMTGAYEMANLFLPDGLLFRGRTRDAAEAVVALADDGPWRRAPLVVLVDGGTLSAAEILAASLAETGRALVIGQTTGGKGVGQVNVDLPLGRVLLVSTLRIETAAGETLQGYGVRPHVYVLPGTGKEPWPENGQPYLWSDTARARRAPLLWLRQGAANRPPAEDPLLDLAARTLRVWNGKKSHTLLEACRAAAPGAGFEVAGNGAEFAGRR